MPSVGLTTLNARGIEGIKGLKELCRIMQFRKKKWKLAILCIQEHNVHPSKHSEAVDTAKMMGFTLTITYGRADATDSNRGGVLILTEDTQVQVNEVVHAEEGFIRLKVKWGAKELDVATVYAPSRPVARIDFFNHIKTRIDSTTIIGGDWNTVEDKTLDVCSANPLGYANQGGTLLNQIMIDHKLVDERREQLGVGREFTRKGNTQRGTVSTRLDRWYTPEDGLPAHLPRGQQTCFQKSIQRPQCSHGNTGQ
jgi:exonuclease III